MKQSFRIAIVATLVVIVIGLLIFKQSGDQAASVQSEAVENPNSAISESLPRLLDLGADKCIPCKMMAPILEELQAECKDQFEVVFIDVWKHPEAAKPYNIKLIPTQIFFNGKGQELFRHEGFFSKEDILAKWNELGIQLTEPARQDR